MPEDDFFTKYMQTGDASLVTGKQIRNTSGILQQKKAESTASLIEADKKKPSIMGTIKNIPATIGGGVVNPYGALQTLAKHTNSFLDGLVGGMVDIVPSVNKQKFAEKRPQAPGRLDITKDFLTALRSVEVGNTWGRMLEGEFVKGATGSGSMSEESARSLWQNYLDTKPQAQKEAEMVGRFTGLLVPYVGAEKLAATGLAYAAPKFVQNHRIATQLASSLFSAHSVGQAHLGPDASLKERGEQALWDTAFGVLMPAAGAVLKYGKDMIFRQVAKTRFAGGAIEPGGTVKGGPSTIVSTKEGDLTMATNNLEAVQNYLKSSGRTEIVIEPRPANTLGTTKDGIPVTAYHKFSPKTGTHTIYVSNAADAQTIAHEWGHYVDDAVAKEVRGLSRYLFSDATAVKNSAALEDTLKSLAVKELTDAGEKTLSPSLIDSKMSEIIGTIRTEARQLASARPDPRTLVGEKKFSEQLADAVSTALTGPGAMRNTMFFKFLQEAKVVDDELVKALRSASRAEKVVEQAGKETPLQQAVSRQKEATREKVGYGGEVPERAQERPRAAKFDKTQSAKEERALISVPQRLAARTEEQLRAAILKAKIPGKNLAEIQVKGKRPVTLVVHEIDGVIMRAIQSGAKSKYMEYATRAVMREFGMPRRQAENYIASRFKDLKAFAEDKAQEGSYVLAKAVRGKKGDDGAAIAKKFEETGATPVEEKPVKETPKEEQKVTDDLVEEEIRFELSSAEAGYRTLIEEGSGVFESGGYNRRIGVNSTFPDWAPEGTRTRKMFDKMLKYMDEGTEPPEKNVAERRLWDAIQKRRAQISERNMLEQEGIEAQRMARDEEAFAASREEAEREYGEMLAGTPDTPQGGARTLTEFEQQPVRMNLDRMDTGKKPGFNELNPEYTPVPFRAEKMTDIQETEVFLNTKVLPEITDKWRIGRSNQDIIDQAALSKIETTEDYINLLQQRVGALAPDVRAGFDVLMNKAEQIVQKVGTRSADDLSTEELAVFRQEITDLVQGFEAYSGIRTEVSNTLRQFGIAHQRGEDDVLRSMFTKLKGAGLASEDDAFKVLKGAYNAVTKEKWYERFYRVLFGAWLSGPATTARNLEATLGNVSSDLLSKAGNPRLWKELPSTIRNIPENFSKGFKEGVDVFKGKKRVGYDPNSIISDSAYSQADDKFKVEKAAEMVGRWLNAQDMTIAKATELGEANALRIYKPDISDEVAKAISEAYSITSVYRGMPKGSISRGLTTGVEQAVREAPVIKLIIPFVRTIGNAVDRQFDYMPVFAHFRTTEKFLARQADEIVKKYNLKDPAARTLVMQRLKDQQMGRAYVGLAVTAAASALAATGRISGNGPENYNERVMLERTGWRRNSIKIGNTWIPYTYIGPLAGIFAFVGNLHDAVRYENADNRSVSEMLGAGVRGWMKTQLNASFFKGTADLFEVIMGNTAGDTYLKRLGTGIIPIPNLYTQSLNMGKNIYSHIISDPTLRQQYETRTAIDMIRQKLGLQGEFLGLPAMNPRSDMFGEPMTLDFIYGLSWTRDKMDKMPVEALLLEKGVPVTMPQRTQKYTVRGKETEMTAAQYAQYTKTSGEMIYEDLKRQLPNLQRMNTEQLANTVESITRKARERARAQILR